MSVRKFDWLEENSSPFSVPRGDITMPEQYAYVAQIAGVLVVGATLIYLAIQTKQNTDAVFAPMASASKQSAGRRINGVFVEVARRDTQSEPTNRAL